MKKHRLITIAAVALILTGYLTFSTVTPAQEHYAAQKKFSLEDRYAVKSVNDVFKYNILHTIDRMGHEFTLQPGESFAFHDIVLPEYSGKIKKTSNSHFSGEEGFQSDGYLMGDGVCHLASFIYMAALEAGLDTKSLVRHDFAKIPDIAREYGVSIYATSAEQNLYITNNKNHPVTFKFEYDGSDLQITVLDN